MILMNIEYLNSRNSLKKNFTITVLYAKTVILYSICNK